MGELIEWIRQQSAWTHSALSYGALAYSILLMPIVGVLVGGSTPSWRCAERRPRGRERLAVIILIVMAIPTWIAGPIFFFCSIVYKQPSYLDTGVPASAIASFVVVNLFLREELARIRGGKGG